MTECAAGPSNTSTSREAQITTDIGVALDTFKTLLRITFNNGQNNLGGRKNVNNKTHFQNDSLLLLEKWSHD